MFTFFFFVNLKVCKGFLIYGNMIEKFLLASSCGNFAGTCWYGDAKITLERKGFYFWLYFASWKPETTNLTVPFQMVV